MLAAFLLAFCLTNIDGFLCLAGACAIDPPRSRVRAVVAAACGFCVLLAVALVASAVLDRFPNGASWFGIVPAAVGVTRLWRLSRAVPGEEANWISSGVSIFSIVLATGGDNVAIYAPLFARSSQSLAWSGIYLLFWTAGCAAIVRTTPDLRRIRTVQRYAEPTIATLFVAIGIYLVAAR